jgi:mono/diheme cytochrome c family protein
MKPRTSNLGSARASRAGDAAPGIVNFSEAIGTNPVCDKMHCGEAPQAAREARALPRICRTIMRAFTLLFFASIISGCETTNYVPLITPQMAKATSEKGTHVDPAELREGRRLFVHRCIECHTLPAIWHYTPKDWTEIVNSMAHRASLKPAERDAVIAYILAVRASER